MQTRLFRSSRPCGGAGRRVRGSRGFALIIALLMLLLLSVFSVGLLVMINTETQVGSGDTRNTLAFHNAEGAIELMTANLNKTFNQIQSPTAADITALNTSALPPADPNVTYTQTFTPVTNPDGSLFSTFGQIQNPGPKQGLFAQIIPVQLSVRAERTSPLASQASAVTMTRAVNMVLIPVFQFGAFSEGDMGLFNSPNLGFFGRIHTNHDLYLGAFQPNSISFNNKITAYGNVIRDQLPNGLNNNTYSNNGNVYILNSANGCSNMPNSPPAGPNCVTIALNQGSTISGPSQAASNQNPTWNTTSKTLFNGFIVNGNYGNPGGTGAVQLSLPFMNNVGASSNIHPFEIIRKPPTGESITSTLGQARLFNQAEIRVLLVDDPAELPGGATDANNIRLANVANAGGTNYTNGVPTSVQSGLPVLTGGALYTTYFAEATTSTTPADTTQWSPAFSGSLPTDWPAPPAAIPAGKATLQPSGAPVIATGATTTWNLIDGYLRVEYKNNLGVYVPITQEWLALGFARGLTPPVTGSPNPVNPKAILIFQKPADRNGNGQLDPAISHCVAGRPTGCGVIDKPAETPPDAITGRPFYGSSLVAGSVTRNNWYPITFYDAREGEPRDTLTGTGNTSCTVNGVMGAVELDVANLQRWLTDATGSGPQVNTVFSNGYILYFSDRRGMQPNPNGVLSGTANTKTGDSGLEDVVNASSTAGAPDRSLEPPSSASPEDVNGNLVLDNWGAWNLGSGLGVNTGTTATSLNPYGTARIANCFSNNGTAPSARKNWVSGARHGLKLVDGSLGQLPTPGFTVASENPVYVVGDYNSSAADPTWTSSSAADPAHSAAAIIADAVTMLSNAWSDELSLQIPNGASGNRVASQSYYRMAIAGGKNITFPAPSYAATGSANGAYLFGTDGGLHNFLRFLEDWSNAGNQSSPSLNSGLNYKGSLVSLYFSTYATGTFKCCNYAVYVPPVRNYVFDNLFSTPQGLPPGTPMFRDVDNLSYRQNFTPRPPGP
ncbi:MAG TPA: hypothetical protein VKZ53_18945 [Candidatus Angelobacter sp.]|nr:hypothetical protein [Candidatus Angelobacter sp.]